MMKFAPLFCVLCLVTIALLVPAAAQAQDSDNDGLLDSTENLLGTDPLNPDTDSDFIDDFIETDGGSPVDTDFDGIIDALDTDSDGDGYPDSLEGPLDYDADGTPDYRDTDADDDGVADQDEVFGDTDGDGLNDRIDPDDDGDGYLTQDEGGVDTDSDGWPDYLDLDSDDDGVLDQDEIFGDTDGDAASNRVDDDDDGDGYPTQDEGGATQDSDADGTPDYLDLDSDDDGVADQDEIFGDSDGDGIENRIDDDDDGDGIPTFEEGDNTADADGDGTPNYLDLDSDNDGFEDGDPVEGLADDDGDGVPNYLDPDSPADLDGDGLYDFQEATLGTNPDEPDSDFDGIDDFAETDGGVAVDSDGDGTLDALDTDSDDDTILDGDEGAADSDADGTPDYRDPDDDDDGIPTAEEGTADADGDGIPNYLDTDSDADGFGDAEEVAAGSDPYDADSTPLNVHDPRWISITDVGNDQGRRVRLAWEPSNHDVPGSPEPILSYSVYRRIDAAKAVEGGAFESHATAPGLWDFVLNLPASGETTYQTLAGTLCDSTDAGVCWSVFFVRAHTAVPTTYYDSQPDSGYSVDNLAPAAPTGLMVAYGPTNQLSWDANEDEDFRYYRIYRSSDPDFVPGPETLVHQTATTQWGEVADIFDHYRITAVDFAGNESEPAAPGTVSGAGDAPRAAWALEQNVPNPFNPQTKIRFSLPERQPVKLVIYALDGRAVRTLVDEIRGAGSHEIVWRGRDDAGRPVSSGTYVYRLMAGSRGETRKMSLMK